MLPLLGADDAVTLNLLESLPGVVTLARASTGTYFDSAGTLQTAASNAPRFDYDPVTHAARGLLIEGQATNSIRNNSMAGAVAADGVERTTNGDFALDPRNLNGWATTLNGGSGTVEWSGGAVTLTGDGTHAAAIGQTITTVVGMTYTITVTPSSGNVLFTAGTSGLGSSQNATASLWNGGSPASFQFVASATSTTVTFARATATPSTIDNVSIQSAGRAPDNWTVAAPAGAFAQIVSVRQENGLSILRTRLFGTTTGTTARITFDNATTAATNGQTWTLSAYLAIVAGAAPAGFTPKLYYDILNGSSGYLASNSGSSLSLTGTLARYSSPITINNASVGYVAGSYFQFVMTAGPLDVTFDVAAPQLEQSAAASSIILTTNAAATRAADVVAVPISLINTSSGAVVVEAMTQSIPEPTGYNAEIIGLGWDGSNTVRAIIGATASNLTVQPFVGGVNQGNLTPAGSVSAGVAFKLGLSWAASSGGAFSAVTNGGTVATGSAASWPALTNFWIGGTGTARGAVWNGYIRKLTILRSRPADAVLQGLTR